MKTSERCKIEMMHHEGVRYKPYLCPAVIWTVGVGSVLYQEQIRLPVVRKDGYTGMLRSDFPLRAEDSRVWGKEEVMERFEKDLAIFEKGVLRLIPGVQDKQGAFDALVSFSFNVGLGALQRSQIRIKANRGEWEKAADHLLDWTKGGGRVLPGLVKRRQAERALFLSSFK